MHIFKLKYTILNKWRWEMNCVEELDCKTSSSLHYSINECNGMSLKGGNFVYLLFAFIRMSTYSTSHIFCVHERPSQKRSDLISFPPTPEFVDLWQDRDCLVRLNIVPTGYASCVR
jgi:hypothetical protein